MFCFRHDNLRITENFDYVTPTSTREPLSCRIYTVLVVLQASGTGIRRYSVRPLLIEAEALVCYADHFPIVLALKLSLRLLDGFSGLLEFLSHVLLVDTFQHLRRSHSLLAQLIAMVSFDVRLLSDLQT